MKALIDADVLFYEVGFSGQSLNKELMDDEGNPVLEVRSWEWVQNLFDSKIEQICKEVEADEPPLLFITNTVYINRLLNRKRRWQEEEELPFIPVFRHLLAKDKPYKFGRAEVKPYHFKNLVNHAMSEYEHVIDETGLEADDRMCLYQHNAPPLTTIICSRDKDLRQCKGLHYSWECGVQRSIGPLIVDHLGVLTAKNEKERLTIKPKPLLKVFGTGAKWLYYQMIVGDAVDNIGGLKKGGPVTAYELLKNCKTERECFEKVRDRYKATGEGWKERMREAADLVYMIREYNEDGSWKRWKPPIEDSVESVEGDSSQPSNGPSL
jgi:hypothetical protein